MATNAWTWANLNNDQLSLLKEAESTLGTDLLLAYQPSDRPTGAEKMAAAAELQVAPLNESQIECLQGLESQLNTVIIAYQQANVGA